MEINDIKGHYYRYIKRAQKQKANSINFQWGTLFFLAGMGSGILFLAFALSEGFENIIVAAIGIFSLLLIVVGIIILINND